MTTSMFFRFISFCLLVVLLVSLVDIFDMASLIGESGLLQFTSWSDVHNDGLISTFTKQDKSRIAVAAKARTEAIWWMAPITAFALVGAFATTRECWVAGEHFCIATKKRVVGIFTTRQKFDLPIQQLESVTVVPLTVPQKAVHDPFKSGWDDTLKSAESLTKQSSFKPKAKVSPLRIPPPALRFPSPTNSGSSTEEDGDATFAASTQDYLLSPTGKEALGRVGMIILSPRSQSAEDLDVHAESQQLIRKSPVSRAEATKFDKHLRLPTQGVPSTPETFTSFVPLPDPLTRPSTQDSLCPEVRSPPPVDRASRTMSFSSFPQPPTSIPLSPSPSPTTRSTITPSPTLSRCPTPCASQDLFSDYVRQQSPTFFGSSTNRDRAHIFGEPSVPTFTPPPPPRVSPPPYMVPELKEVQPKSPVFVIAKGNNGSRMSWVTVPGRGGNDDADVKETSPSLSSFVIDSPSIYSTYSGCQPHPATVMHMNTTKETV